jgi:hypothetical protein
MTDLSNSRDIREPRTRPGVGVRRGEYYTYFALIFLFALPMNSIAYVLTALTGKALPSKGPLKATWCEARTVAAQIFKL